MVLLTFSESNKNANHVVCFTFVVFENRKIMIFKLPLGVCGVDWAHPADQPYISKFPHIYSIYNLISCGICVAKKSIQLYL